MRIQDIVNIDKDIQSGQPVFIGTRVPVESLFDHLEAGISLDEFIDDFPSVTREQAVGLLEIFEGAVRFIQDPGRFTEKGEIVDLLCHLHAFFRKLHSFTVIVPFLIIKTEVHIAPGNV